MTEFKIGDRVRHILTDEPDVPYGTLGTIVPADSGWPLLHVIWDAYASVFYDADYRWAAKFSEVEKWFDESDTAPEQDAIDLAYACGHDDGYALGQQDGYELGHKDGFDEGMGW